MKHLTADPILRKTFAHLDEILHEKNRQMKKASSQKKAAFPPKRAVRRTERTKEVELHHELANSDYQSL